MAWVTYLRLAKFLAIALFSTGALACLAPGLTIEQRRFFGYRLAGPGFGLSWLLGIVLAYVSEVSLGAPFVLGTMAASLVTVNGVLYVAGRDGRATSGARFVVVLSLVTCFVLMVVRP